MNPSSWQQIRDDFRLGAEAYPDVCAHWESTKGLWTLQNPRNGMVPTPADVKAQRLFAEIARAAVRRLGKPLDEQPSWHIWLDLMRKAKRGFGLVRQVPWSVFKMAAEGRGIPDTPRSRLIGGTIAHVFQVSADFCEDLALGPAAEGANGNGTDRRAAFVSPILEKKGWSILDWANNAEVDFHTANDYLKGATKPYASTRKKLADALGVAVENLPA